MSAASLQSVTVAVLVVVGTFFLAVGTIGLLRLPNVYNRLHATSKAATLGSSSILLGGGIYFGPAAEGLTSLVGIVFLFLTAPTGGHMISRSARRMGVPFLEGVGWPTIGEGIPGAPGDVPGSDPASGDGTGSGGDPDPDGRGDRIADEDAGGGDRDGADRSSRDGR